MGNMKAKELRIGNFINYRIEDKFDERKEWLEVSEIDAIDLQCIDDIYYSPIPITKEWLIKFGFKKNNRAYKLSNFGKFIFFEQLNSFGFYPAGLLNSLIRMDNLKSVHQLQNLYFALTGEELEING
jgi:hypothetical protein